MGQEMKKPAPYKKGQFQSGACWPALRIGRDLLPKAIHLHCEEMTAKDARKLAKWLLLSAKWMEKK